MDFLFITQQSLSAAIGVNTIIFALAAIGLNMHFGYTGLLNFGQAGFLAVGAYSVAVAVVSFNVSLLACALNRYCKLGNSCTAVRSTNSSITRRLSGYRHYRRR